MKTLASLFLLISLCSLAAKVQAQTRQIKFTRINTLGDLAIGQVNFIAQDKYGFIWLSEESYGSLTRFDGQNLKRYQNIPGEINSLGGSYPECLFIDQDGIIWIGFFGQGLDRFDPVTETFTHYRHDPDDPTSLINDNVSSILRDHLGNLFIATFGGLSLLNEETGEFVHYQHQPDDNSSLSSNFARELYEDRQGTLWVGTGWFAGDAGGLNQFKRNTGAFIRYMADYDDPNSLINERVTSIFEDSRGNFWVGTGGDGLHTMDRETGKFTRYRYDPQNPKGLSAPSHSDQDFGITYIAEDMSHNLWIGSVGNGTSMYNFNSEELTHFGNNTDALGTPIENGSWCIYFEQNGLIWLSTQPGLYIIDPNYIKIPSIDYAIPSFFRQSDSVIWYESNEGLVKENLITTVKTRWNSNPMDPNSISSSNISTILVDSKENIWVGTEDSGLNKFDTEKERFMQYRPDSIDSSSIRSDRISALYEDRDGSLWVGTIGGGLNKLNPTTGEFSYLDTSDLPLSSVSCIVGGGKDELWIGQFGGGSLAKLNTKKGEFRAYSIGNGGNHIYKDKTGKIWVATPSGLYRYNESVDNFTAWSNDPMIAIFEDEKENLWASSISQVLKINKDRDYIIEYFGEYIDRGSLFNTYDADSYKGTNGRIHLGDGYGYYVINPDSILVPHDTSKLYFTNFWIGETLVKPEDGGTVMQSLLETSEINLDYNQNTFSLSFTEIDFRNGKKNKIHYLLENYDLDWRETFAGDQITYSQVPSGEYAFKIRAPNSSTGIWADKSISITIFPPWWLTWWAYIIYGIIFIFGVFFVDRIQRRRLLNKAMAEAKEKELEQAREIEKAYNELKTTQSQLIQSEKMASLGELTAGIAHEIQNPLNFVNNFSDVNTELVEEIRDEIKKGNTEEVYTLLKTMEENEKKIVHHGKRAEEIVKSMLQHSRGSEGKKEPTHINTLADEYLRLAYHGMRAKDKSFNADFKTELDPDLPKINVVPQDIGRVLLNLINNAFHAVSIKEKEVSAEALEARDKNSEADPSSTSGPTKDYKPTVTIITKTLGDKIQVSIKDNGPGVPEQVREKIFQPFFTTKATGEGTGLGLSLSYDIITKGHGGELSVDSETGKGTIFSIQLPVNKKQ